MFRLMVAALVCFAFAGCAWLAGGQDPEVVKARAEADAAIAEAKDLKTKRAEAEVRHALEIGMSEKKLTDAEALHAVEVEQARATADADARRALEAAATEKLAAAKAVVEARIAEADQRRDSARSRFDESMETADEKFAKLKSAIDASAKNVPNLSGWGATIGGLAGPIGAAIGGLAGIIIPGIIAWRKTRDLGAALTAMQASREELAEKNPEALKLVDAKLKAAIPAPLQDFIRKLKKKGVLAELPKIIAKI